MTRQLRWTGIVALLSLVAVCTGCEIRGGGNLPSASGNGKATFAINSTLTFVGVDDQGFNVYDCNGEGEYHDPGMNPKVDVHLDFNVVIHGEAFGPPNWAAFLGDYTPQPRKLGAGGTALILVMDNGEPGHNDSVLIILSGGIYDGYSNSGTISGGNIQVDDD
jgi:hypothetical protein